MEYSNYYEENLYPTQDAVMKTLKKCELPFYLTGGTAVSRGYFHHRYSDDLDFFVNNDSNFQNHIEKIQNALKEAGFSVDIAEYSSLDFSRFFINKNKSGLNSEGLKIDFVNDIASHFGEITNTDVYYRTDSLRNILSNKYTALYRFAIKDIVDICEISKHISFNWAEIIQEADQKEGGIELREVYQIFMSFKEKNFKSVKWINEPNIDEIKKNIEIISRDMLTGSDNSLCKK